MASEPTQAEIEAMQRDAEAAANLNGDGGDHPGEGDEAQVLPEILIEGEGQLSLKVGGKKPDKGTVKIQARSVGMPDGIFEKGDTLTLELVCNVAEVHFIDKRQGTTGEVIETERRHILAITNVRKAD